MLYYNPSDPGLQKRISELDATPGYCIFVDIVGSTDLKNMPVANWAAYYHNTFVNIRSFPGLGKPLKIIGDCCMFYISETKLNEMRLNTLSLFTGLCKIADENLDVYAAVKISATFCNSAYELTFFQGQDDFNGRDIDLTHRLLGVAKDHEIVMNEGFVMRVREPYSRMSQKEDYPEMGMIVGPELKAIKSFGEIPIYIYKWPPLCKA